MAVDAVGCIAKVGPEAVATRAGKVADGAGLANPEARGYLCLERGVSVSIW